MADPTPFRRSINWNKLRTDEAERLIRERVQDTDNVIISRHARAHMEKGETITFYFEDAMAAIRVVLGDYTCVIMPMRD